MFMGSVMYFSTAKLKYIFKLRSSTSQAGEEHGELGHYRTFMPGLGTWGSF